MRDLGRLPRVDHVNAEHRKVFRVSRRHWEAFALGNRGDQKVADVTVIAVATERRDAPCA